MHAIKQEKLSWRNQESFSCYLDASMKIMKKGCALQKENHGSCQVVAIFRGFPLIDCDYNSSNVIKLL